MSARGAALRAWLALLGGLLALPAAQAQDAASAPDSAPATRVGFAELSLRGPLREATLSFGALGRTRVRANLRDGELRRVVIPVPLDPAGLLPALDIEVQGGLPGSPLGAAAWSETLDRDGAPADLARNETARRARWSALPLGLARRPVPPPIDSSGDPSGDPRSARGVSPPRGSSLLLLACAVGLIGLGWRSNARGAVLCCVAGAALIAVLGARAGRAEHAALWVIDHDPSAAAWIASRAAQDQARIDLNLLLALETRPVDLYLDFEVDVARAGAAQLQSQGVIVLRQSFDPRGRSIDRSRNAFAAFDALWTREAGALFWDGPRRWERAGSAPAADDSGPLRAPPGWLVAGLPQASAAWVARVDPREHERLMPLLASFEPSLGAAAGALSGDAAQGDVQGGSAQGKGTDGPGAGRDQIWIRVSD